MDHTYLRYECADSVGLCCSTASSSLSNALLDTDTVKGTIVCTAGSQIVAWREKQTAPIGKIFPYDESPVGTGRALHPDQVVCVVVSPHADRMATGWHDGTVRVYDIRTDAGGNSSDAVWGSTINSFFDDDDDDNGNNSHGRSMGQQDQQPVPLTLRGHSNTSVSALAFAASSSTTTTTSGSSNAYGVTTMLASAAGKEIVLWDLIDETGLFRLKGHTGVVVSLMFYGSHSDGTGAAMDSGSSSSNPNFAISCDVNGTTKVWDLSGQCCIQTLTGQSVGDLMIWSGHGGGVNRCRMLTGNSNGKVTVWKVETPQRQRQQEQTEQEEESKTTTTTTMMEIDTDDSPARAARASAVTSINKSGMNIDDLLTNMGTLLQDEQQTVSSAEKILSIRHHNQYVGILQANAKVVLVYKMRTETATQKKQQRRLKRRKEKSNKKMRDNDEFADNDKPKKGRKKGLLDDDDEEEGDEDDGVLAVGTTPTSSILASDEFEFFGTIRTSHKIRAFAFLPFTNRRSGGVKVVCALSINALEVLTLVPPNTTTTTTTPALPLSERSSLLDMYGHPTGIRSVALSSDDVLACTVSKNAAKLWNVAQRSCRQSIPLSNKYGLCVAFLPGNTHVVVGTREGRLLLIETASGDIVFEEEQAHDGAIWSLDVRRPNQDSSTISVVTGSADKLVKFWDVEEEDEDDDEDEENNNNNNRFQNTTQQPVLVHTRTLKMADDVVCVRYSHSTSKRLVFAASLDSTIKVFFDDSLKFFLSLYGHKLPVLAMDASDDDMLLASSGADKTIKIWGLDFGDTHRTLHGHQDSVTDLRFVRRTHNFFTASKDGTIRYWDGDRFEQILLLPGHSAEVQCLTVSHTGAFVLTGGMDRQMRIWERTRDMVFLDEERERELEQRLDAEGRAGDESTGVILRRNQQQSQGDNDDNDDDDDDDDDGDGYGQPQSEAAVKRSILSVSAGDRIMEGLERADQELKDRAASKKADVGRTQQRMPNPLLLGLDPAPYVLWILKSIKNAELEQSLLVLPLSHVERLLYYLVVLLRAGRGVELCSRIGVFLVKTHNSQLVATRSLSTPLQELRRLVRTRLSDSRDRIGFNMAALRAIAKLAQEHKESYFVPDNEAGGDNVWAGLGLGSDVAAALESRGGKRPKTN